MRRNPETFQQTRRPAASRRGRCSAQPPETSPRRLVCRNDSTTVPATASPNPRRDQPVPDQSAALRLAALDGADRPAQGPRSLLVRTAFKVAKHDRCTIFQRQPVHLLVDRGKHIGIEKCPHLDAAGRILLRVTLFVLAASNTGRPQIRRRAAGDLMEPGPQRVPHPERSAPCEPGRGRWPGRHLPPHARSRTMARQTRQTIASCRSTSAAKASSATSSASVANRSRSWPSVSVADGPDDCRAFGADEG